MNENKIEFIKSNLPQLSIEELDELTNILYEVVAERTKNSLDEAYADLSNRDYIGKWVQRYSDKTYYARINSISRTPQGYVRLNYDIEVGLSNLRIVDLRTSFPSGSYDFYKDKDAIKALQLYSTDDVYNLLQKEFDNRTFILYKEMLKEAEV